MAFLIAVIDGRAARIRARRDFKPRRTLEYVCERELKAYRFSRMQIGEFIAGYEATGWPNSTERSHAIVVQKACPFSHD